MTVWTCDPSFTVDIAQHGDEMHVRFCGDLDAVTAMLLRRSNVIAIDEPTTVVLDLSRIEWIDMSGVREIRRIAADLSDVGGHVHLRGATPWVQEMLDLISKTSAETSTTRKLGAPAAKESA